MTLNRNKADIRRFLDDAFPVSLGKRMKTLGHFERNATDEAVRAADVTYVTESVAFIREYDCVPLESDKKCCRLVHFTIYQTLRC